MFTTETDFINVHNWQNAVAEERIVVTVSKEATGRQALARQGKHKEPEQTDSTFVHNTQQVGLGYARLLRQLK